MLEAVEETNFIDNEVHIVYIIYLINMLKNESKFCAILFQAFVNFTRIISVVVSMN